MTDNFNLKQFLIENKLGAYSRLKENIDTISVNKAREYAESFEDESVLSNFDEAFSGKEEVTKEEFVKFFEQWIDDMSEMSYIQQAWRELSTGNIEYNMEEVDEAKEKEGYMGTQYDSSEDMAVDMVKKGITEKEKEVTKEEQSQEKVTEVAAPVKAPSPTAVAVTRFWRSTFLPFVEKRAYNIDIEAIEDALDSAAGKRISTGQLPEFGKLNTAQLQKVILFLMQVIKRKKFDMFDTWDKKTNTIVRDTDEDDDYFEESEDPSQEKVTEGNRPWDFNVYDMDAMQMAQFKKAAERLGFTARLDEVGIGVVEIRLFPSNDKTFKQAFKIIEKMGLEFDESHGMFSEKSFSGINEVSIEAMDRMDGLVSQTAVKALIGGAQTIIRDLKQDGFEDDEIFDYIMERIKVLA